MYKRQVNIIGDSISHGANAPKIPEQSYVGLFKKAADAEWQGGNYGFVSLLAAIDNASGVYKEIHTISRSGSWQTLQTGDFLGAYAMRLSLIHISPGRSVFPGSRHSTGPPACRR